jgi:hypothetical protein
MQEAQMGGTDWSNDLYADRATTRKRTSAPTFAHHADVASGRVAAKAHAVLDVFGITVREARDSDNHPESLPVMVMLDVTGSMASVPGIVQRKLPKLMEILLDKGYCKDPAILVGAVGDALSDRVPMQAGQFESGIEIDEQIGHLYLEANGGGGEPQESYQLALYLAARCTATDAWEKRGKKGFLFIIGDEKPYGGSPPEEFKRIFDHTVQETVLTRDLVREAKERWHIFYLMPKGTSHYKQPDITDAWAGLIGSENLIMLDDPNLVCETIGATVGMIENAITLDKVVTDLGSGADALVVRGALDRLAPTAAAATSGLPVASVNSKISATTRL